MTITTNRLTATAGVCAAVGGALFIGVQINHPPADLAHIATTEMSVRETAKIAFAVFAMTGFTGMYLHQHRRVGILGLVGYGLLMMGFLALFAVEVVVGYVLPVLAESNPGYVQRVITEAMGGAASGRIGHLHEVFLLSGMGYAFGGLLFGIALFRAGVLARWASLLLAYASISVLALAALPESFSRPFAIPMGVALIGLGWSLRRQTRTARETVPVAAQPAVVG